MAMTQKQIAEKMAQTANNLKCGLITIFECEQQMTETILTGTLAMGLSDNDKIMMARKLKRRMWRMLLDATK